MSKLIIPTLSAMLCCFIIVGGCGPSGAESDTESPSDNYIFKVGEKVVMRPNTIGTIHRITQGPLYHIKVFNEDLKGHVVHRVYASNIFEFIEEPR